MKKIISISLLFLLCSIAFAQEASKAEKFAKIQKEIFNNFYSELRRKYSDLVSLEDIKSNQGYYMQNQDIASQNHNRSEKLFKLHVNDQQVFLDEVDIIVSEEILVKRHELKNQENLWCNETYKIRSFENNLFIFDYTKHEKEYWEKQKDYHYPFVKVCDLNQLDKCPEALSLTTEHMLQYAGLYSFESCYIIESTKPEDEIKTQLSKSSFSIKFDGDHKQLYWGNNPNRPNAFVETNGVFYKAFGDGGTGSNADLYCFYEDGIAIYHFKYINHTNCDGENDGHGENEIIKYVVFYKKL